MGSGVSRTRATGPVASGAQQQPEPQPEGVGRQEIANGENRQPTPEKTFDGLTDLQKKEGITTLEDFCNTLTAARNETRNVSLSTQIANGGQKLMSKFVEALKKKDDYLVIHVANLKFASNALQCARKMLLEFKQRLSQLEPDNPEKHVANVPSFLKHEAVEDPEKAAMQQIRVWLAQFSDGCSQVRLDIGKTEYLEDLLKEIRYVHKPPNEEHESDKTQQPLIDVKGMQFALKTAFIILHNCSKEKKNQQHFQKTLSGGHESHGSSQDYDDGISVLSATMNTGQPVWKAFAAMTLCYVVPWRDTQVLQLSKDVLNFIIQGLKTALRDESHQSTFRKLELCEALLAFADVESNRKQISDEDGWKPLAKILVGDDLKEKVTVIKILQKLVFEESTRGKVEADEVIMDALRSQQNDSDPDFKRRVKKLLGDLEPRSQ